MTILNNMKNSQIGLILIKKPSQYSSLIMSYVFVFGGCSSLPSQTLSPNHKQVQEIEEGKTQVQDAKQVLSPSVIQSSKQDQIDESILEKLDDKCTETQEDLYQRAMDSTQKFSEIFLSEVKQLDQRFEGFQLSARRSQMMIFFGDGLMKRLDMVEAIAGCSLLYKRYITERQQLFLKVEELINQE